MQTSGLAISYLIRVNGIKYLRIITIPVHPAGFTNHHYPGTSTIILPGSPTIIPPG